MRERGYHDRVTIVARGCERVAPRPRRRAVRLSTALPLVLPIVLAVIAAYIQWITKGLPATPAIEHLTAKTATQPFGFPAWIGITHFVNLLFLVCSPAAACKS